MQFLFVTRVVKDAMHESVLYYLAFLFAAYSCIAIYAFIPFIVGDEEQMPFKAW